MTKLLALLFSFALFSAALADGIQNPGGGSTTNRIPGDITSETTPGAGNIGEVLAFSNAAQAIANNTTTNSLTGSVTAGHWRCDGSAIFNPGATTTMSAVIVAVTTNATPTFPGVPPEFISNAPMTTGSSQAFTSGPWFFNFTTTTNVFVTELINYGVSTMTVGAALSCQRIF